MARRLAPGTPVAHSRTGMAGTVAAFLPDAKGSGEYVVVWASGSTDRKVAPRYVEAGGDVPPAGR